MNRRQLLVSSLAATAASALGLKAAPAVSAAPEALTRYGTPHPFLSGDGHRFLWGPPGIGKSSVMMEIAGTKATEVIDLPLVTQEFTLGFPDHPMIPTKPLTFSARDLITEVTP